MGWFLARKRDAHACKLVIKTICGLSLCDVVQKSPRTHSHAPEKSLGRILFFLQGKMSYFFDNAHGRFLERCWIGCARALTKEPRTGT